MCTLRYDGPAAVIREGEIEGRHTRIETEHLSEDNMLCNLFTEEQEDIINMEEDIAGDEITEDILSPFTKGV